MFEGDSINWLLVETCWKEREYALVFDYGGLFITLEMFFMSRTDQYGFSMYLDSTLKFKSFSWLMIRYFL